MIAQLILRNVTKNISKNVIYLHVSYVTENVPKFENVIIDEDSIEPLKILYEHFGLNIEELGEMGSFTEKLCKFRKKYVPKNPMFNLTELEILN